MVVSPGRNDKGDDRQVEFYPPWESENPNPGKLTIQPYRPELTHGQGLADTVSGELLHYIGGVNPQTGRPIDPDYQKLKQQVIASRQPWQDKIDRQIYKQAVTGGEDRSFSDWLNQSRADEYIMGYVTPDKTDEWRKNGWYNSPNMQKAVQAVKSYLTSPSTR